MDRLPRTSQFDRYVFAVGYVTAFLLVWIAVVVAGMPPASVSRTLAVVIILGAAVVLAGMTHHCRTTVQIARARSEGLEDASVRQEILRGELEHALDLLRTSETARPEPIDAPD